MPPTLETLTVEELAVTVAPELLPLAPVLLPAAAIIAAVLALIVATTTPAQAPGLPHPPLLDRDTARLRELVAKHAAGTLTKDEEAELIALLAKVKGIRVQKLSDLVPTSPTDPGAPSPWTEKRRSRIGYKGGQKLERRDLQQLSQQIKANYGIQVELVKKGSDVEKMMDEAGGQAGFAAKTRKIYVRRGATYYELSHERYHAEQWHKLGDEAYSKQTRLDKETYVYERLMREKSKLTPDQVKDATDYINNLRTRYGLPTTR